MECSDYKLSSLECKDLTNCKFEYKGIQHNIDTVSYLPYGHLIFVEEKEGCGNSYVLHVKNGKNGKEVEISPCEGGLAVAAKEAIQEYYANHKEYK